MAVTSDGWVLCSTAQGVGLQGSPPAPSCTQSLSATAVWAGGGGSLDQLQILWEGLREAVPWRQRKGIATKDLEEV